VSEDPTPPQGYPPPSEYWTGYPPAYSGGGQPPSGYMPPYPGPMAPSTSGWAIASLILAICGWVVLPLLGSIGGVVTGHIALHEIADSQGRIEGRGFAIAGLIIGYAGIAAVLCTAVLVVGLILLALPSR
jgi:Domain of unknown function (DUF4190)